MTDNKMYEYEPEALLQCRVEVTHSMFPSLPDGTTGLVTADLPDRLAIWFDEVVMGTNWITFENPSEIRPYLKIIGYDDEETA